MYKKRWELSILIYISSKNKDESQKIKSLLIENNVKEKIYIEDDINSESLSCLSKSKIIICDNNIEKISFFLAKKKKIAVYNENKISNKYNQIINNRSLYTYKNDKELIEIINYNKNKEKHAKLYKLSFATIIIVCLLVTIFKTTNINNIFENKANTSKKDENEIKKREEEILKEKRNKMNFKGENIVFFGDSITDYYDLEKYYGKLPVVNSGIAGNQTKDLLNDIEDRVIRYNPTKVFILVGTNDIAFTDLSNEEIADKIIEIGKYIKNERKNAKIYIEAIYPISKEDANIINPIMVDVRDNGRIKDINKMVKEMCKEEGFTYIDMYNLLVNDKDNLTLEYTVDGLHVNDKGYEIITETIKKYIYNEI